MNPDIEVPKGDKPTSADERAELAYKMYKQGKSYRAIALKLGIKKGLAIQIVTNMRTKNEE